MAYKHDDSGIPECAPTEPEGFVGKASSRSINGRGSTPFEGNPNADGALAEFGGVSSAHKSSSILSHGPVDIPKEGGPDSNRS